jgi:ABC-type Na+ efflux pump permease subunit
VLTAILGAALAVAKLTRGKVAALFTVFTLGALLSSPVSPVAAPVGQIVGSVDFLSITTVVLTVAGLSLGKDLPKLRGIGWRIVPVGIVAIAASYLLSTVAAEFALGLWH